jgi:hypothetical protein
VETSWLRHEVQEEGFAISLPSEWSQPVVDPEALEAMLAAAGEQNPGLGNMLSSEALQGLVAGGIKFYSQDTSPESAESGIPTSVIILKINTILQLPLDTYVAFALGQIRGVADPQVPITNRRVTLSNAEAEEIKYAVGYVGPNGDIMQVMITHYLVVDGSTAYVITLSTSAKLADEYSTTFEEIGRSFRVAG